MSRQAQPILTIPELTIKVARTAFRKGNVYMLIHNRLGTVLPLNITRVLDWSDEVPRSQTHVTRFGQLAA